MLLRYRRYKYAVVHLCRQMKDQSKKVASLKHKEQVEKSRNARLMEEARKREDNMSETSQQVKVRPVCG